MVKCAGCGRDFKPCGETEGLCVACYRAKYLAPEYDSGEDYYDGLGPGEDFPEGLPGDPTEYGDK